MKSAQFLVATMREIILFHSWPRRQGPPIADVSRFRHSRSLKVTSLLPYISTAKAIAGGPASSRCFSAGQSKAALFEIMFRGVAVRRFK